MKDTKLLCSTFLSRTKCFFIFKTLLPITPHHLTIKTSISSKNPCKQSMTSLVGVPHQLQSLLLFIFSEILLNNINFFGTMDYSSWGLKNRIGSKNSCMQVENYVKYMQTKFGGCRFFGFGNFAPVLVNFKMATI